jgi:hypothetical protein
MLSFQGASFADLHVGPLVALLSPRMMVLPLLALLLWGLHRCERLSPAMKAAWLVLALALTALFGARCVQLARANVAQPPEWDFQFFWIYGRTVVEGLNPYVSANLHEVAAPLDLSEGPLRELFCFYPPPTLFLFAPLGWFELQTACGLWYAVQGAILLLDVVLLWRLFGRSSGWTGLVGIAALVVAFEPTRTTLYFAQVNFLMLLMLLLFWRDRGRSRSGMWLALGILVKPVLVFLSLDLLLRRRWQALASCAGTFVIASALSVVFFGAETFVSYVADNPIANDMPKAMYAEPINQSLLATVLRLTDYDLSEGSPYSHPLFVVLGVAVAAVTVGSILRLPSEHDAWAPALLVAFALLVYPKTLTHYSVLLLVPLLVLWTHRRQFAFGVWGASALFLGTFAAASADWAFLAIVANWIALAGITAWMSFAAERAGRTVRGAAVPKCLTAAPSAAISPTS